MKRNNGNGNGKHVERPCTCERIHAHWDVKGKCFFCGKEVVVVHNDTVAVKVA